MPQFCHLHCHTQYSLLDGAAAIDAMVKKAVNDNMPAVAITDHGNMFGVFNFYLSAKKHGIKPIIGCEFYIVDDRFSRNREDIRYHQLILAKDATGYQNLSKLCSLGFIEGFYYQPRIDKALIRQYREGLIATSCCAQAEVPYTLLNKGEEEAEKVFLEWLDIFGDDYYVELQRHGMKGLDEERINRFMIKMARKYGVKIIATNDSHYVDREDWFAHDILLCINTGDYEVLPVGDRGRKEVRLFIDGKIEYDDIQKLKQKYGATERFQKAYKALEEKRGIPRFGFENDQFYFKTRQEMAEVFSDLPEALENTLEIVEKIDTPELKRDILLPHFKLPEGFTDSDAYLRHLAYAGARRLYGELTPRVTERLEYELAVIRDMRFADYFLIVQDFVQAANQLGVSVGPGRGSAAGSLVAYTTGITKVDPLKYNLLFERFLTPGRVSMPDIDIDFDDRGRQKVIEYVIQKYGKNQVAQIITYARMGAKSSIRDVARVMQYPLNLSDQLAKMIPEKPGMTFKKAYEENPELLQIKNKKDDEAARVISIAELLEGSIRQRGVHAAGVIIAPDDLTKYIPVCTHKDSDMLITQFEGKVIEDAGMLKMDFLGLKNLTIIRDCCSLIREIHGVEIDPDRLPLDDPKTYEIFQKGMTKGIFQFESSGMQKYLKALKPDKFEDLIAICALYRPGPMEYIDNYIARKYGKEKVEYDLPEMEEILSETYGITVYQEQVMLLSQKLAGFSPKDADLLRKAMGKKIASLLNELKPKFIEGCIKNGYDRKVVEKIWSDWESFAHYAFNKSHSTCYALIAYQTAYLKAHYPAEFMASLLDHNMESLKKVESFMRECNQMDIEVLGPDVNESNFRFTVNQKGQIRFGLGAIKGMGERPANAIVEERKKNGPFTSIFDLTRRVNLREVNKKCLESLALAGAFDSFPSVHRAQYFAVNATSNMTLIETAIKYGNDYHAHKARMTGSLFGDITEMQIDEPPIPDAEPWHPIEKLKKEQEVIGMYLSGHPLDQYRLEFEAFVTCSLKNIEQKKNKKITVGGILTQLEERMSQKGKKYATFKVEDFDGTYTFQLFGTDYLKMSSYLKLNEAILITGSYQPWNNRKNGNQKNQNDEYKFRIESIRFLEDCRKHISRFDLVLSLESLNNTVIEKLKSYVAENPGNSRLRFILKDEEDNQQLKLISRSFRIEPSGELLKLVESLEGCQYDVEVERP